MQTINKLLLVGLTIFMGCSVGSGNWNDHINRADREKIKVLDSKIIDALAENNPTELKEIFSDELEKNAASKIGKFVETVHEKFKPKDYSILDEYLENNSVIGTTAVAIKAVSSESDYKISYPVLTKETYISLLINNGSAKSELVTCIYGKYGSDWKLTVLKIGDYSYFGMTAIAFYKQAKANYEKGNLVDAATDILMIQRTATPADDMFHYQNADTMAAFANKAWTEVNAKFVFPIKVEEIKTTPQILNFSPTPMAEGIFPTVGYLSKINLKDTVALKKENDDLKKVIGKVLPGIDKGKKYVFFKAYNEIPNGKTPVESYGFILNTLGQ
jgi:hypothetical protein